MKKVSENQLSFAGQNIYVGLDVHLSSWSVTILTDHIVCRTFTVSRNSSALKVNTDDKSFASVLSRHLNTNYPDGIYKSAYEAGFCGFSVHTELIACGINNIVVNPADIPTSQKQQVQKNDHNDSLKIALALRAGQLKSIYVPNQSTLNDRMLLRVRSGIVNDIRRFKTQIKSMLNFHGIKYKWEFDGGNYFFSKKFMNWVRDIEFPEHTGMTAKSILLDKITSHREKLLIVTREIRTLSLSEKYRDDYANLITIPGVSLITSMSVLTETENIRRFGTTKKFIGYLGLHPTCHSSGETQNNGDITFRHNKYLRSLLVESAHIAVQKDPALMQEFIRYRREGKEYNVAIIKIARKLACRIYYMLRDKHGYEIGVVQ